MLPSVSVIVPIYNVEAHLERCVRSLLEQTLSDLEIILVDDASTDRSGELADAFTSDSRVVVVHSPVNRGLAATRNAGLDAARGTWISFVDSDDFVAARMLEHMVAAAEREGADVVGCALMQCGADGEPLGEHPHPLAPHGTLTHEDMVDVLRSGHETAFMWFAWRNLYRRSMLEEHGVRFDSRVRFAEDSVFNLHAFWHARAITTVDEPLYCYRKNPQGLTRARSKPHVNESLSHQYAAKKEFYGTTGVYPPGTYGDLHRYVLSHQLRILLSNARAAPTVRQRALAAAKVLSLPMVRESAWRVAADRATSALRSRWPQRR